MAKAETNLLNRTGAAETSTMGTRMADPLKETMAAVAREKREEIERLKAKLSETEDADLREGLNLKLAKLHKELEAAERVAGVQTMAVVEAQAPTPAPAPHDPTMPKGATVPIAPEGAANMTKAQLEELVHSLQAQVESLATEVHRGGFNVNPDLVQQLETTRARLLGAMYSLAQVTEREGRNPNWKPHQLPEGFVIPVPEPVVEAPKPPTRAALEAQVRELQVELLERARDVERAPIPAEKEKARLAETRDKLHEAMQALTQATKSEISELAGVVPPKPTPQQMQEADTLLRQANVARVRGNKQQALDFVQKAALIAPGSVAVLEVLGDDLAERGQVKIALETYAKALALDPSNPNIERKYGEMVVRSKGMPTAEEFARLMEGGLSASDSASKKSAAILSLMLPGLGQLVMGQTKKGALIMGTWLGMIAWMFLMPAGIQSLVRAVAGASSSFNPVVLIPIIVAVITHITAVATAGGAEGGRKHVDRPRPPVDLPFE